jgi:hypothetical protein
MNKRSGTNLDFLCLVRLNSYDDLQKNYKVHYVAGGAAQNAARGAQVSLLFLSLLLSSCFRYLSRVVC